MHVAANRFRPRAAMLFCLAALLLLKPLESRADVSFSLLILQDNNASSPYFYVQPSLFTTTTPVTSNAVYSAGKRILYAYSTNHIAYGSGTFTNLAELVHEVTNGLW